VHKTPFHPLKTAKKGLPRYLKSEGRRSVRLHFSHSAMFLTLPLSKRVFILTSPPQEQKNFWVVLEVRAFLLAWAIVHLLAITMAFDSYKIHK
jgi:hypothetical protein